MATTCVSCTSCKSHGAGRAWKRELPDFHGLDPRKLPKDAPCAFGRGGARLLRVIARGEGSHVQPCDETSAIPVIHPLTLLVYTMRVSDGNTVPWRNPRARHVCKGSRLPAPLARMGSSGVVS